MHITVNGLRLYYECGGQGRPLILLHGNGESHEIFSEARGLLEKIFTVYALDSRGHGKSDAAESFHYSDMAEDVRLFIGALHLEKPLLYGFSDGGIIGLMLAAEYPSLLLGLIISGANTHPLGLKKGWLTFFKFLYRFNRDPLLKLMLTEPNITKEALGRIEVPTLVLAGAKDMIKRSDTEFIAANIKGSRLRIIPRASHGSYIVHKRTIAELIKEFAEEIF